MNGWWIGLLVVLALLAGAGALAWTQALLVHRHRSRTAGMHRAGGNGSGAGPVTGGPAPGSSTGPGPAEGMGPGPAADNGEGWYQSIGRDWSGSELPDGLAPPVGHWSDQRWQPPGRHTAAITAVDGITGVPRAGRYLP